ncbi:MAG: hypothetical protein ABSF69_03815 [Polyangiaceae bacterium]
MAEAESEGDGAGVWPKAGEATKPTQPLLASTYPALRHLTEFLLSTSRSRFIAKDFIEVAESRAFERRSASISPPTAPRVQSAHQVNGAPSPFRDRGAILGAPRLRLLREKHRQLELPLQQQRLALPRGPYVSHRTFLSCIHDGRGG